MAAACQTSEWWYQWLLVMDSFRNWRSPEIFVQFLEVTQDDAGGENIQFCMRKHLVFGRGQRRRLDCSSGLEGYGKSNKSNTFTTKMSIKHLRMLSNLVSCVGYDRRKLHLVPLLAARYRNLNKTEQLKTRQCICAQHSLSGNLVTVNHRVFCGFLHELRKSPELH